MGKTIFVKGDHVVAKNWSGEEFLGIYDYNYSDGSHCVMNVETNKRFCCKPKDVKNVTEEQEEEIKKILKEKKTKIKKETNEENNEELEIALAATEE